MRRYTVDQYKQAMRMAGFKGDYSGYRCFFKCPKHSDRRPSLSVSFDVGLFNCFQCGYSGSISTLVWDKLKKPMNKLLGLINSNSEMDLMASQDDENWIEEEVVDLTKIVMDVRGELIPFFQSTEALAYLEARHIDYDIAKSVGALFTKDAYINEISFINRLVIPVYEDDRIVNYEGRDVTFKSPIKCVYPKNALKPLFEHYKLDKNKPIFVFEGLIKTLVARSDPYFRNSTTSMGTMISSYQLKQLKEFKEIVLCPDNDKSGNTLVKRVMDSLSGTNNIKVLRISDMGIKDVDEIPKETGKSVQKFREQGGFYHDLVI